MKDSSNLNDKNTRLAIMHSLYEGEGIKNPKAWRVYDAHIRRELRPEHLVDQNTFEDFVRERMKDLKQRTSLSL